MSFIADQSIAGAAHCLNLDDAVTAFRVHFNLLFNAKLRMARSTYSLRMQEVGIAVTVHDQSNVINAIETENMGQIQVAFARA